ncbi:unnamed protein product [Arabis nemorensis]|uniref:Uncharacterized protein n=1 Tax=Arabis nemorensis TaxID=586526 RepID=A0A565CP91_9BRAS|nr:unnamed protein product [Arabis nemorensis]
MESDKEEQMEEHDDNYEAEGEVADEFDSDFSDDPEPDEAVANEKELRDLPKKWLIYPGKTAPKKKKKNVVSKIEDIPEDEKPSEESENKEQDENESQEDMEGEKAMNSFNLCF